MPPKRTGPASVDGLKKTWRRRLPVRLLSIVGHSMHPALANGDYAIIRCRRQGSDGLPPVGSIVVFHDDGSGREFVKRVIAVAGDLIPGSQAKVPVGTFWVLGDNPAWSTDSRLLGPIHVANLVGTVVARIPLGVRPPLGKDASPTIPWVS